MSYRGRPAPEEHECSKKFRKIMPQMLSMGSPNMVLASSCACHRFELYRAQSRCQSRLVRVLGQTTQMPSE